VIGTPANASSTHHHTGSYASHAISMRGSAHYSSTGHYAGRHGFYAMGHGRHGYVRYATYYGHRYGGISCVPYAREVSGIEVPGNAWQWWYNAEGVYARGYRPEAGSVLAFRANGRMRLGHVAVVSEVINAREVMIDHANWPGGGWGGVSHGVVVVDVSESNDWSAVRLQLPNREEFGSVYPTYGFIYNRPDTGEVQASVSRPTPVQDLNPAPADLRPAAERPWHAVEEVAQSPVSRHRGIDMRISTASDTQ
jgi:surface antigen